MQGTNDSIDNFVLIYNEITILVKGDVKRKYALIRRFVVYFFVYSQSFIKMC